MRWEFIQNGKKKDLEFNQNLLKELKNIKSGLNGTK